MKKQIILAAFLMLFYIGKAQESKLIGSWLMTKVESPEGIQEPLFITDFRADHKMVIMGIEFGTWEYDKKNNSLQMFSELEKDFNGTGEIVKLNEEELQINKDGARLFYKKVYLDEILKANKASGLTGTWVFKGSPSTETTNILTFSEPDEYNLIEKSEYSSSKIQGTWIYDQQDNSLILIGFNGDNFLKGKNSILKINDDSLVIKRNGGVFKAERKIQNSQIIEHLNFSEDDFYSEDGDYKYEDDEEKIPWRNSYDNRTSLLPIDKLVYNYSTLILDSEIFENKTLVADVQASLEEEAFQIDYIFNGYDRYTLPEDSELPQNSSYYNALYPLEVNIFRIARDEQVTTPAGTFECTVLEAIDDFGALKKLWMINDKPGIYAKIIDEDPDPMWGHYNIYELIEIKKK